MPTSDKPPNGGGSGDSNRKKRVWRNERWYEAMTVARDLLGRFARKGSGAPDSQLLLFK